ncbi:Transcription factor IWS1 [Candida viswanathii]|uniref:Transcription factor IWS1 n=1 Tax=Candida viswanathii TaxID=5486 RepID=A0A367XT56_9ASCO|nr:Transcription factor IWS1 [Candida viswanathii]
MSDPLADFTNLSQDEAEPKEQADDSDALPGFEGSDNEEHEPAEEEEEQEQQTDEPEQQQEQEQEKEQLPSHERQGSEPIEDVLSTTKIARLAEGQAGDGYVRKNTGLKRRHNNTFDDDDEDAGGNNDYNDNDDSRSPAKRSGKSYHPDDEVDYETLDPQQRRRLELEERMSKAIKPATKRRRKADEDDIERMQDDKIDALKEQMIKAATLDVDKNSQGHIATEKLKLLSQVTDVLARADLAISILDNNLLEAVRLWLEPLPDASMPAYQIQKELINALETLPIKTDHLAASGIGKVLVFYQRSKRTEPLLKKVVDRLIGDWTRPILNKSDSYKDRSVQFHEYNKSKFTNKLSRGTKRKEAKTLYEQNAERRKRAAIPSTRTTAYKIAPLVDKSLLMRQQARHAGNDERFKKINQKLTSMSVKRKTTKKGGPSIEGRGLAM